MTKGTTFRVAVAVMAVMGVPQVAAASTVSAPMTASLIYPSSCAVGTIATLDFGTGSISTSGAIAQTAGTSSVNMACTNGTPYDMWVSSPNTTSSGQRRMTDGNGHYINYLIGASGRGTDEYQRQQPTTTFYTAGSTVTTWTFYGTVPAQSGVLPGTYTDTLTFGVFF